MTADSSGSVTGSVHREAPVGRDMSLRPAGLPRDRRGGRS